MEVEATDTGRDWAACGPRVLGEGHMAIGRTCHTLVGTHHSTGKALALAWAALLIAGCTERAAPTTPSGLRTEALNAPLSSSPNADAPLGPSAAAAGLLNHDNHQAAAADKGLIDGWFNGEEVQLYYTKSYFCAEPPDSGAPSGCVIGADAEVSPRPGPIPAIYAIAAAGGIQPDVATLACPPGSVCLNHPRMIDASRVVGPLATNVPAVPHSHIIGERRAGWFKTVNIRVTDLAVWNEIVAAKSLAKVRALQADPAIGGQGKISADTPTNVFFFIASWR